MRVIETSYPEFLNLFKFLGGDKSIFGSNEAILGQLMESFRITTGH